MFWRVFRKDSVDESTAAWWREAEAAAAQPSGDVIERLAALAAASPGHTNDERLDETERRLEMLDGLRAVQVLMDAPSLPVVVTQHRAIGADVCHYIAPVGVAGESGAAGKLFLTAARLVFAGPGGVAWPWHRIRDVVREGRTIFVSAVAATVELHVQCNTYGDALVAEHLIRRLARRS